jgi:ParB-like chromosome segregation protein Spo0J
MAEKELPKVGDRISVEKFHVSEMNMRYGETFGEDEEDQILIANVRARRKEKETVTEPFSARPEGAGYGVYKGSRRFQAMRVAGFTHFVVGKHCLIRDVTNQEAADASWIENLSFLRKSTDPITRAKKLSERLAFSPLTLRQIALRDGVAVSTYSEWLKVLELSEEMQQVLKEQLIPFSDGLTLAKLKLGEDKQNELANLLKSEGLQAFKLELARIPTGKFKRGIPSGVWRVDRILWDKRNRREMQHYAVVEKAAKKRGFEKIPDYEKDFIIRHIDEIKREAA